MYFPVAITGFGILVCLVCSFLATNFTNLSEGYTKEMTEGYKVRGEDGVERHVYEEKKLGPNVLNNVEKVLKY